MGMLAGMNADERRAWGPVVALARKARGMTQEALATAAGISRPTLRTFERGDTAPQPEKLVSMLQALDLIDDLSEPDVTEFLARMRPLLQKLDPDTRARLMPALVQMVARALEVDGVASDEVEQARRRRQAQSGPGRIVTDADLIGQRSVAEPERDDHEGDEDPEGP